MFEAFIIVKLVFNDIWYLVKTNVLWLKTNYFTVKQFIHMSSYML